MSSAAATTHEADLDLDQVNAELEDTDAIAIIEWAARAFGDGLVMTSSFGIQSAVMLHLVTRVKPDVPIILIDTGYLFPETYRFAEELRQRLDLNLKVYAPRLTAAYQEALYGKLWEQGPDGLRKYHQINKIEPTQRAMRELKATAWAAGLRAEQTDHRATLRPVELQDGIYKVHPILHWSNKDVHDYLTVHDLPYHPLREKNYFSIGDTHSSRPMRPEDLDERSTRFHGLKQECGIHLPGSQEENQSREGSNL